MKVGRKRTTDHDLIAVVGKKSEHFVRSRNLSPDVIACLANERRRNKQQIGKGTRKKIRKPTERELLAVQPLRQRVQFVQQLWEGMQLRSA